MFELEYLYEQVKRQTIEQNYINVLNVVSESCYDTTEFDNLIEESMVLIEEASKKGNLSLLQKLKTNIATAEKILSQYKEAALKSKPYGLEFKGFKTFVSDSEIKSLHKKAISYLNKFDPSKASEEQLKKYIEDSSNNVQYNETSKIFGKGKERFVIRELVVEKESDKELTKNDVSEAVKFLSTYSNEYKKVQDEFKDNNDEYTKYARSTGLATNKTNSEISKLRQNAANHKRALIAIADSTYYQMLIYKMNLEFKQAKQIVVKAANHNPRNLKESTKIQMYIDAMYDFHEE